MKKFLTIIAVVILCTNLSAQKSIDRLIDKMKERDNTFALTLPGWVLRAGFKIATSQEIQLEDGYKDILKGIKRLRVLHIEDQISIENSKLGSIVSQMKEKDGYEEYASVREKGGLLYVVVKEKKGKIKSLVVISNSEDGFTILNLKTDIRMEELKKANLSFNQSKSDKQ